MNITDRYQRIRMCVFRPEYLASHSNLDDQDFTGLIDTIVEMQEIVIASRDGVIAQSLAAKDALIAELVAALKWCTRNDGECLADYPLVLNKFDAVLAKVESQGVIEK